MREEFASLVFPVFRKAIEIKQTLHVRRGDFADSRKKLLSLLQTPVPQHLHYDVVGEPFDPDAREHGLLTRPEVFLGARYALACWLDEFFIEDSPWRKSWSDNTLEKALYRTGLRTSEFWEQARRAAQLPSHDALETYYLCVLLGFRGDRAGKHGELKTWRDATETQIMQGENRDYVPPKGPKLAASVPVLKGASERKKWARILVGAATAVGAVGLLLLLKLFRH